MTGHEPRKHNQYCKWKQNDKTYQQCLVALRELSYGRCQQKSAYRIYERYEARYYAQWAPRHPVTGGIFSHLPFRS